MKQTSSRVFIEYGNYLDGFSIRHGHKGLQPDTWRNSLSIAWAI